MKTYWRKSNLVQQHGLAFVLDRAQSVGLLELLFLSYTRRERISRDSHVNKCHPKSFSRRFLAIGKVNTSYLQAIPN